MSSPKTYSINLTVDEWEYIIEGIRANFNHHAYSEEWEGCYLGDELKEEAEWSEKLIDKIKKKKEKQNKEFNQLRKEINQLKKEIQTRDETIKKLCDTIYSLHPEIKERMH